MYFLFLSLLYLVGFFVQSTRDFYSNEYDHDLDQFMYFGSRLLHGELIWVKEFDDKSPVLQFLFAIPAYFKNTGVWVLISTTSALIAAFCLYSLLIDLFKSNINYLSRSKLNQVAFFCSILYLTLQSYVFGGLLHINSFASSLNLICIYLIYFGINNSNNKHKNTNLRIAGIIGSLAISVRPYLLFPISLIIIWAIIRKRVKLLSNYNKRSKFNFSELNYLCIIKHLSYLFLLLILFNFLPYILTGNLDKILIGIKLNSINIIKHNIFIRQYINIGRNPILYPILISFIYLPLFYARTVFNKEIKILFNSTNFSVLNVDIIFFSIICPLLLEISFYNKHFWGHYFNFFTPYACISIAYIIVITLRYDQINSNNRLKHIRNIFLVIIMTASILTDKSLTKAIIEVTYGNGHNKIQKLSLVQSVLHSEKSNKDIDFLFPENNYIHWKLDQSRHGFPQKIVYRNITNGKMEKVSNAYNEQKNNFLLPSKNDLCSVIIKKAPDIVFTYENSFTAKCLESHASIYKKEFINHSNKFKIKAFKRYN